MSKQVLSNLDFNNVARITNLPDGVGAQEPATVAQLNAAIQGLAWKDDVVVDTTVNTTISAPGATLNGISMSAGQRWLARGQTAQSENGIYIWNGAATPATRAADCDVSAEFNQAITTVQQGPNAGTSWRQTAVNPTVGSTSIVWTSFGTAAPQASTAVQGIIQLATQSEVNTGTDANKAVTPATLASYTNLLRKFAQAVGDGSATSYTITHNLNTLDCEVTVYRNSGSGDEIMCDVNHATVNTVTLIFASAPSSNQFRVVVIG